MYADEKILLTLDKINRKVSKTFNILERKIRSIQSVVEDKIAAAFNNFCYLPKKYNKKLARSLLREQRLQRLQMFQRFLGNPLEI